MRSAKADSYDQHNRTIGGFTLQNLGGVAKPANERKPKLTLQSQQTYDKLRSAVSASVNEWVERKYKSSRGKGENESAGCSPANAYAYVRELSPEVVVFECHHDGADQNYIASYRIDHGTGKAILNEPQPAKNTWTSA